jgi:hypothetical protein
MKTNSDTTTRLYIGLDVHKEQTSVAIAEPGSNGEVRSHGSVATTQIALERLVRQIAKSHNVGLPQLHVCYEGGLWHGCKAGGHPGRGGSQDQVQLGTLRVS